MPLSSGSNCPRKVLDPTDEGVTYSLLKFQELLTHRRFILHLSESS